MNTFLFIFIEGIVMFTAVWAFNYFVFVRKMKKYDKDEMPIELIYLAGIYKIDPAKVNYKNFQRAYCLINAFIITFDCLLVIYLIKTPFIRIIVGIVLVILLIIICYGLLGRYYQNQQRKEKNNEKES